MFADLFSSKKLLLFLPLSFLGITLTLDFYGQSDEEKKTEFLNLWRESDEFKTFSLTAPSQASYSGKSGWEIEVGFRSGAEGWKTFKIFDTSFEAVNQFYRKYSERLLSPVRENSIFSNVETDSVPVTPRVEVYSPTPDIFLNKDEKKNSRLKLVAKIGGGIIGVLIVITGAGFLIDRLSRRPGNGDGNAAARRPLSPEERRLNEMVRRLEGQEYARANSSISDADARRILRRPEALPILPAPLGFREDEVSFDGDYEEDLDAVSPLGAEGHAPAEDGEGVLPRLPAGGDAVRPPAEVRLNCLVCLNAEREMAFRPCNHLCCCQACAAQVLGRGGNCPVCRSYINSSQRIYT